MLGAIVLAGGQSARMGTNKLALAIDGATLLSRAVDAVKCCADRVVVAGPKPDDWPEGDEVGFVVEEPPFGGPVAGMAAALHVLAETTDPDEVLILAGDLADPAGVVRLLMAETSDGVDGRVLVDDDGWPQYLAGCYRFNAIGEALPETVRDVSVRSVFRRLNVKMVQADVAVTKDIDTREQALAARATRKDSYEK